MSKKTFNYVSAMITAVSTAAVASVSYFCEPTTAATTNGIITAVTGLAISVISKFVKDDEPETK
jgi:hypothetical protein